MTTDQNNDGKRPRTEQPADTTSEGRSKHFMTLDSWNQDGNYYGRFDEFGPELEEEAPPTHNGKRME